MAQISTKNDKVELEDSEDLQSVEPNVEKKQTSVIDSIITSTKGKINELLEGMLSPISRRVDKIKSWFKKGLDFLGFGKKEEPYHPQEEDLAEESEEEAPKEKESENETESQETDEKDLFKPAKLAEQKNIKRIKKRFLDISNAFRKKAKDSGKVHLDHPELQIDTRLTRLAEESVDDLNKRINNARMEAEKKGEVLDEKSFEYHDEEFLTKHNVSENHAEGFRIEEGGEEEALEILLNSRKHRQALLSNSSKIGIAIKSGVNLKGEPVYHMQILYDCDKSKWAEDMERSELPAPDDIPHDIPLIEGEDMDEVIDSLKESNRTVLALYFDVLKNKLADKGTFMINKEETEKLSELERKRGDFVLEVEVDNKLVEYVVNDHPPHLLRRTDGKIVMFEKLLSQEDSEMSADELREKYEAPSKEPNPRKDQKEEVSAST